MQIKLNELSGEILAETEFVRKIVREVNYELQLINLPKTDTEIKERCTISWVLIFDGVSEVGQIELYNCVFQPLEGKNTKARHVAIDVEPRSSSHKAIVD